VFVDHHRRRCCCCFWKHSSEKMKNSSAQKVRRGREKKNEKSLINLIISLTNRNDVSLSIYLYCNAEECLNE
jgi:hypothetical protein